MNRESYLEHYSCNDNWLRILEGEKLAQATRLNRAICGLFTSHESEIRKLNKEIFELRQKYQIKLSESRVKCDELEEEIKRLKK